jgi:mono/diheme cytochrome c family protein
MQGKQMSHVSGNGIGVQTAALAVFVWLFACVVANAEQARPENPFEGRADVVENGRSLFNQYCAHCHGPNAQQGERPRDLRRLKIRYEGDAISVFYTTINNGRVEKGMPVWKGVLSEEVMWQIYTYLQTVQTEP